MKIIPKTKKDFAWVDYKPKDLKNVAAKHIKQLKFDIESIKNIPKKDRTFENTVLAIENAGLPEIQISIIDLLAYVSPDKLIRDTAAKVMLDMSRKQLDIIHDEGLYKSFTEFQPNDLEEDQKRLYKDMKKSFKNMGFGLAKTRQEELKKLKKEINKLEQDASLEINNSRATILCTKTELAGMDAAFIGRLQKDKKTKKYVVSTDYPEFKPFIKQVANHQKRKELIDKYYRRGGVKNLKRLRTLLNLRERKAKILGYNNYPEYVLEDRIAKNPRNVGKFLHSNLKTLKPIYLKLVSDIKKVKGGNLTYFDHDYYLNEYIKKSFSTDEQKVKEYFELYRVLDEIFKLFGHLFGVSFKINKEVKLWHRDVFMIDVVEKGKKIAHLIFDLFPRPGKYSHACHASLSHGQYNYKLKGYEAPLSVIISNSVRPTKNNPSLFTFWDVEALYHEFGHACHFLLTRARYASQSGTSVRHDFVETPSQLFEKWLDNNSYLQSISKHYKTGKKLGLKEIKNIQKTRDVQGLDEHYRVFVMALFDLRVHLEPKTDLIKLRDKIWRQYSYRQASKVNLWPANFGHIYGGYDVGYYAYMWAIAYSCDVFSRFKKEGIKNKRTGMDLRRKILEKGDSVDPIKLMTQFLGRKPNSKAFLDEIR